MLYFAIAAQIAYVAYVIQMGQAIWAAIMKYSLNAWKDKQMMVGGIKIARLKWMKRQRRLEWVKIYSKRHMTDRMNRKGKIIADGQKIRTERRVKDKFWDGSERERECARVHYMLNGVDRYMQRTVNHLSLKVLVMAIEAQWEGMGDVGLARYEPALLPPCPTIRVLSYSS